jgi:hypothetical protein
MAASKSAASGVMAKPTTEPVLTADDLVALSREIVIEAQRARARVHLSEKLFALADLIKGEDQIRQRVRDLEKQAEMVAVVVARADVEQQRLDEITAENDRMREQARAEVEGILYSAEQESKEIVAEAVRKSQEEAEKRADEARRVELSIASRQAELEHVSALLADLRAKIGA